MKKRKYLLLTLLVLVLAFAMIACGKDKKSKNKDNDDDDDKTTKTEATEKPGKDNEDEDTKTEDKTEDKTSEDEKTEDKTPEDQPTPVASDDSVAGVLMNAAEALKGLGKVTSCSVAAEVDANVTYQGKTVVAKGTVGVDATVDPAVMKIVIDANAMGQNIKYNIYCTKEDGKWFMVMDMNGQLMKVDADQAKAGTSQKMEEAFAKIAGADLSTQDTAPLKAALEKYGDMLKDLKVSKDGGKIVIGGTISEDAIKKAVQLVSSLNKNATQLGAMLPAGFGGIDFSLTFDESTKLFESFSIDLSKLADAFTQQTGSVAKATIKVSYNNVSKIDVPEAQLIDPSALGAE